MTGTPRRPEGFTPEPAGSSVQLVLVVQGSQAVLRSQNLRGLLGSLLGSLTSAGGGLSSCWAVCSGWGLKPHPPDQITLIWFGNRRYVLLSGRKGSESGQSEGWGRVVNLDLKMDLMEETEEDDGKEREREARERQSGR